MVAALISCTREQPDPMPAGCPLTSPTTFAVSAALSVSLDESGRVEERYGQVAAVRTDPLNGRRRAR